MFLTFVIVLDIVSVTVTYSSETTLWFNSSLKINHKSTHKSTQNHIKSISIPGSKYLELYQIDFTCIAHPY